MICLRHTVEHNGEKKSAFVIWEAAFLQEGQQCAWEKNAHKYAEKRYVNCECISLVFMDPNLFGHSTEFLLSILSFVGVHFKEEGDCPAWDDCPFFDFLAPCNI